ncbi:MAG: molecular chaperone DjlA, partial [Chloroflexota bacterium]
MASNDAETATDWYEVLQVSPNASREVIEAAYRSLSAR